MPNNGPANMKPGEVYFRKLGKDDWSLIGVAEGLALGKALKDYSHVDARLKAEAPFLDHALDCLDQLEVEAAPDAAAADLRVRMETEAFGERWSGPLPSIDLYRDYVKAEMEGIRGLGALEEAGISDMLVADFLALKAGGCLPVTDAERALLGNIKNPMKAEIERLRWQPPETAPTDSKVFEITTAGPNQDLCWWDEESQCFRDYWHKQSVPNRWPHMVAWRPLRDPAKVCSSEVESRAANGFEPQWHCDKASNYKLSDSELNELMDAAILDVMTQIDGFQIGSVELTERLLSIAQGLGFPELTDDSDGDADIRRSREDGWSAWSHYDFDGEFDYLDYFISPEGQKIQAYDWPPSLERDLLLNWRPFETREHRDQFRAQRYVGSD